MREEAMPEGDEEVTEIPGALPVEAATRDSSEAPTEVSSSAPGPIPSHVRPPALPNYDIVGFLGEGGMGRVFRAVDRQLGRTVALKCIRGDDRELIARFLQEARAQARIEHENVCRVFQAGEADGQPFIAMQLVRGRSLGAEAPSLTLE